MTTGFDEDHEYQHLTPLFWQLADPATPERDKRRVRDALVTGHLPLAAHIARRYAYRGQPADDLEQVARLGLIHAVDRFEPARGYRFLSFAVPTITGEIRRYFRDATWSLAVPRSLRERHLAIQAAIEQLSRELKSAPRPREIAARLNIPIEQVYEGLQAGLAYYTNSLDGVESYEDRPASRAGWLAEVDKDLDLVDDRETLYRSLSCLPERDASIVLMRFFGNMTQTHIAQQMGLSQMQVSRVLSRSLALLRCAFNGPTS